MTMHWQPPLPESVQEIADVIGRAYAVKLIGNLPQAGSRKWRVCIYVPKRMRIDHPIVQVIGYPAAKKLSWAFAGMILQPSNCKSIYKAYRNREMHRMAEEGLPDAEIAAATSLSPRQVREILASEPPEEITRLAVPQSEQSDTRR